MCVVEVEGSRVMAASCVREVEPGMIVRTATEKIERCRGVLIELLMSEQPEVSAKENTTADDQLFALARRYGAGQRLPRGNSRPLDDSSKVIDVDHQACILCDRWHTRLRRRPAQRRDRAHRQGLHRAHLLRPRPGDGRVQLR